MCGNNVHSPTKYVFEKLSWVQTCQMVIAVALQVYCDAAMLDQSRGGETNLSRAVPHV